jgi:uncharacterized DUF497 family protein
MEEDFEWDLVKEAVNKQKHQVDFTKAALAFKDPHRLMYTDEKNSLIEMRMFCVGNVDNRIMTVRFVLRNSKIRIIGAGYWRKGEKFYEERNNR